MKNIRNLFLGLILLLSIQSPYPARSNQENTAATVLNVLRSDDLGLTLELLTPGYRFENLEIDGLEYDALRIDGAGYSGQPGSPQIPVVTALIGVPPGASLRVIDRSGEAQLVAGSYRLPPAPQPAGLSGDFQPGELAYVIDQDAYSSASLLPEISARLGGDAWLRDRRIARIELFPFQYVPSEERLYWRERLLVEIAFEYPPGQSQKDSLKATHHSTGADPFASSLEGELLNEEIASSWRGETSLDIAAEIQPVTSQALTFPAYRIPIAKDGLYRLSYQALIDAGLDVDHLNPNNLHLTSQGQDVAAFWKGDGDNLFESGESLIFYGQKFYGDRLADMYQAEDDHWMSFVSQNISGTYTTWTPQMNAIMLEKYTDENVYWLSLESTPGLRMNVITGAPGSAQVAPTYRTTVHAEESYYWKTTTFTTEDTWFWDRIYRLFPVTRAYTSTLSGVAVGIYSARLRGELVATTQNPDSSPDHHIMLYLNSPPPSPPVDDRYWDGKSSYHFDIQIPQSSLIDGINTLTLVVYKTPNMIGEEIFFNWFELEYERLFQAISNEITFAPNQSGTWRYQIGGFSSSDIGVLDITSPVTPTWVSGGLLNAGNLSFQVTHGDQARFYAGAVTDIQASQISHYQPADLSQQADYLVITHADFLDAAQRLADYRQTQGFTTMVIDIQDLYNQYNYGIFNPLAIKNYLRYAFDQWSSPPTYAVLIGDGNWNFKGYPGYNALPIYIPPNLSWVDPWQGEVDSANLLAAVVGDDILPDLYIGRIPVNSPTELDAVVDKIIAYEAAPRQDWQRNLMFIADNTDQAGNFAAFTESFIQDYLEPGFSAQRIYEQDYGCSTNLPCPQVNDAITTTLNSTGTLIANFIGHASLRNWTGELIFVNEDIPTLNNASMLPVVLSMTCLDGYWIHPGTSTSSSQSLIEEMLRTPNKGMIASFSPTGLGVATGHDELQRGFYDSLFKDGNWVLGQAALQAKLRLFASGGNDDLIQTFTIFGDPALRILSPYSLDFSPADQSDSGPPGATIEYTFQITNTGAITDTFAFEVLGADWQVTLPQPVALPEGGSADVSLSVAIPADAADTQSDTITLRTYSQGDTSKTVQAQVTTTAFDYGVRLSADVLAQDARAGDLVTYILTVLNNGAYLDGFDITLSGNQWAVDIDSQLIQDLQPGESAALTIQVQVPLGAPLGAVDAVTVTAASLAKPTRTDQLILTTRIPLHRLFLPAIEK